MIEAAGLSKRCGPTAVDGLLFTVSPAQVTGFLPIRHQDVQTWYALRHRHRQ